MKITDLYKKDKRIKLAMNWLIKLAQDKNYDSSSKLRFAKVIFFGSGNYVNQMAEDLKKLKYLPEYIPDDFRDIPALVGWQSEPMRNLSDSKYYDFILMKILKIII